MDSSWRIFHPRHLQCRPIHDWQPIDVGIIQIGTCSDWARVKLFFYRVEHPMNSPWSARHGRIIRITRHTSLYSRFTGRLFSRRFFRAANRSCVLVRQSSQMLNSLLYYSAPAKHNAYDMVTIPFIEYFSFTLLLSVISDKVDHSSRIDVFFSNKENCRFHGVQP